MTIQNKRFTIHQVCRASDVSRTQVNQWISRGFFAPEEEYEHGKQRSYSFWDAVRLRVFTDLMRIGLSQEIAGAHSKSLHGFKSDKAVLVIHHGPSELISVSERGKPIKKPSKASLMYDPTQPPVHKDIIKLSDLPRYMGNPHVFVAAMINLDSVVDRVEASLARILETEAEEYDND